MHFSHSPYSPKPYIYPIGDDIYKLSLNIKPDGLYHKAFPPKTKLLFNLYKKSVKPVSYTESVFKGHELKNTILFSEKVKMPTSAWIVAVILFIFILVTWVKIISEKRFIQIFKCLFSPRLTSQLTREGLLFSQRGSIELFVAFVFSTSLLIFLTCDYFMPGFTENYGLLGFVKITLSVSGLYLGKYIILKILGSVFNVSNEIGDYITNVFVFNEILGIVFLPLLVIIAFNQFFDIYIIDLAIIIFILFYIYRLLRGMMIGTKNLKFSKFYLFLYLCTLEILPLIVIIKMTFRFFEIKT